MGVLLALFAATLITAKDLVSKKLAFGGVDGTTSAFASFFYALPMYAVLLTILWMFGYETFQAETIFWVYIGLRSFLDCFGETSKMHALSHGDLSVVSSLIALHPVLLLAVSPIITGDAITLNIVLGLLLSVAGTWIITHKSSGGTAPKKAILYGLTAAVCASFMTALDRKLVQTASPVLSGAMMTFLAALFLSPILFTKGRVTLLRANTKPFFVRGFFETVFMCAKLSALLYLSAPELSAITRLSVIFSVFGGNVMFKELDFKRKLLGALLTVSGVVLILLGHR